MVILLFKMVPQGIAEVLSSAPKHEKAAMCLTGKKHVLAKLCSEGVMHGAIGCQLNVDESTLYVK